ncbi:MAG: NAD(P)/FAD-dependent oxidoreductase [Ignavibacteriaceae bacterium]|nr:NAD(P)/FAD-dependent oxidoreductase [Ignavibacteriaceae bacterium]
MISKKYDIVVIGGGPAGASAAMSLSEKGYTVIIVEKKSFPREVLCGEFISKEVIEFLKINFLYKDFLKLNPNPIRLFRYIASNGTDVNSSLNFPSFGIKRSKFDNLLLSKAGERGAEIIQPAEVRGIIKKADGYLITIKVANEEEIKIFTKIIIAAYGKQNILDKISGRNFYRKKSCLNGVKFHIDKSMFRDFNPDEIVMFDGDDIYLGLNAVDNSTVTLCFLEKRNKLNYSTKERLILLSRQNRKFNAMLSEDFFDYVSKLQVYGTGNIYFGKRDIVNEGIYYLGDAAGVIAPLVGDGIGIAVQSAGMLSEILFRNNLHIEQSANEYRREWKKMFLRRMYIAGIIQKGVLNHSIRNTGIKVISRFPRILSTIIKYTRG